MITDELVLQALQIVLLLVAVLVAAFVGQWVIDWLDRRGMARMRTASERRMERDITGLRRQVPSAHDVPQEPWRDTMPPAETAAPRRQHHANRANVHQLHTRPEREARR